MTDPIRYEFPATDEPPVFLDTRYVEVCGFSDDEQRGPSDPNVLTLFEGWPSVEASEAGDRSEALIVIEDLTGDITSRVLYVWPSDEKASAKDWTYNRLAEIMVESGREVEFGFALLR